MSDIEAMQIALDQQKASLQMMHENYTDLLQCVIAFENTCQGCDIFMAIQRLNDYNKQALEVEPHKGELIEIEEEVIT